MTGQLVFCNNFIQGDQTFSKKFSSPQAMTYNKFCTFFREVFPSIMRHSLREIPFSQENKTLRKENKISLFVIFIRFAGFYCTDCILVVIATDRLMDPQTTTYGLSH